MVVLMLTIVADAGWKEISTTAGYPSFSSLATITHRGMIQLTNKLHAIRGKRQIFLKDLSQVERDKSESVSPSPTSEGESSP